MSVLFLTLVMKTLTASIPTDLLHVRVDRDLLEMDQHVEVCIFMSRLSHTVGF